MSGGDAAFHCSNPRCNGWRWQVLAEALGEDTCIRCGSAFMPKATPRPGRAPSATGLGRPAPRPPQKDAAQAAKARVGPKAKPGQKGAARKEAPWARGPQAPRGPAGRMSSATMQSSTELTLHLDSQKESPLYKAEIEHQVAVALHGGASPQADETARRLQEQKQAVEAALPVAKRVAALEKRREESDLDLARRERELEDYEERLMTLHNQMDVAREAQKKAQNQHQLLLGTLREAQEEANQAQASDQEEEDDVSYKVRRPEDFLRGFQNYLRNHPSMLEDELKEMAIQAHQGLERLFTSITEWAEAAGGSAQHEVNYKETVPDPWTLVKGKGKKGKGKNTGTPAVLEPQTLGQGSPNVVSTERDERPPSPKRAKGAKGAEGADAEMPSATEGPLQVGGDGSTK